MPLATLGNLMGFDGMLILVVLLLFFGAKKLPELARGLGQSLNEFRKAREDFEHELRAGQEDPQARAAANRQPYTPPAAVPAQTLPYTAPIDAASTEATVADPATAQALKQQVEQLQAQLRALEAKKADQTTPVA